MSLERHAVSRVIRWLYAPRWAAARVSARFGLQQEIVATISPPGWPEMSSRPGTHQPWRA